MMKLKLEQKRLRDVQIQASRMIRQEKATQRSNKRKLQENSQGQPDVTVLTF